MTDWINPPPIQIMDSIGFNNFFIFFYYNYMIKTYAHKIERLSKNRHLLETIIPRKQTKINNVVHFPTNLILNEEIKKE